MTRVADVVRVALAVLPLIAFATGSGAQPASDDAASLRTKAIEHYGAGRVGEAAQLARQALKFREAALPPGHPEVADSLYDLAYYTQALGDLAAADPLFQRALQIREQALPAGHLAIAQSHSGLGVLRQVQGRYGEAEPYYRMALAIREKSLPPGHALVAQSINNLAYLYQLQGRLREAEPMHKRALSIWEQALPPGHPQLAWSLVNLGIVYFEQGRLSEAETLQRRALEIREKALPKDHPDIARSLNLVGSILERKKLYPEAQSHYRRALAMLEKALPAGHPDIALALMNLAIVYDAQGQLGDAEIAYKRALAMREAALPESHPAIATTLSNLGILYRRQGRFTDAESAMRRALDVQRRALPADHPAIAKSLGNLAVVGMARKDWPAAFDYSLLSADALIAGTRRDREKAAGTAEWSSGAVAPEIASASIVFQSVVKVAHRLSAAEPGRQQELAALTFTRGQWATVSQAAASLAQMAARNTRNDARLARLVRERQDLVADWRSRDRDLLAAVSLPREKRDAAADRKLMEQIAAIDSRIGEIDKTLAAEFPEYAMLADPEPLSISETQRLLRHDEALVLMLEAGHASADLPDETFVWVVTRNDVRWVRADIGGKALADTVYALRCGLDAGAWHRDADHSRCRALLNAEPAPDALPFDLGRAHRLYKLLFGQVEDAIKGKHLLLVASGALASIPFQVLVTEGAQAGIPVDAGRYASVAWLAKRHAVTVLPSAASLRALRQSARKSAAVSEFLGFGNPLLLGRERRDRSAWERQSCRASVTSVAAASRGVRDLGRKSSSAVLGNVSELSTLEPLPETADELCAVAASTGATAETVFLGARASEATVKSLSASGALARSKVIHFATHGLLAGEAGRLATQGAEPALVLTPPERASDEDDGLLTASEIAQLSIDADWVVLSACNTAAGDSDGAAGGETLSGLARAFFYAGARALLVSHWAVDSAATVELVTTAFGRLKADRGMGKAEALRQSMLSLLNAGGRLAHPAIWAPFVVVGEGAR